MKVSRERIEFAKRLRVYLKQNAPKDKDGNLIQPYRYWAEQLGEGLIQELGICPGRPRRMPLSRRR